MIKKWTIVFALMLCILLAGCINVDIECGVNDEHAAYLRYAVRWDLSSMSTNDQENAYEMVRRMFNYWENQGFEGGHNLPSASGVLADDVITITMQKQVESGSDEEAFEHLVEMLSDPAVTPFVQVDADQMSTTQEQSFYLTAKIDLSQLVPPENLNELPQAVRAIVERGFEEATGSCTVVLPGNVVSNGGEQRDERYASMSVPFSFTQSTTILLQTRQRIGEDEPAALTLHKLEDESQLMHGYAQISLIAGGVLGVICLILVIAALVRASKRRSGEGGIR